MRAAVLLLAVIALGSAALVVGHSRELTAIACGDAGAEAETGDLKAESAAPAGEPDAGEATTGAGASSDGGFFDGPAHEVPCAEGPGHPESFADLARANSSRLTRTVAPGTRIKPGAYRAALGERAALDIVGGPWQAYGKPPLVSNKTEYDTTNGSTNEGLGDLSGRVNAFATDGTGTTYAAVSNGGIWKSTDQQHWTSIGDGLPTQVVSGIAWTSAGGGTLIVLTGDLAYGGDTYAGLGVYRSADGGATWKHSAGIPDGLLGFRIVVDPTDATKVYAATGGGLYRSTDSGATFTNVNLPTGANAPAGTPNCSGQPPTAKDCFLANMVTDVVVQGPTNTQTPGPPASGRPGAVMASVGWRAGNKPNAAGAQQSPGNGIYVSNTGAPGTFQNMDLAANSTPTTDPLNQSRIGRIALGIASGPAQDHRIVYALVQDAVKFNGGALGLDANENGAVSPAYSDYLNAVWVSKDFGATWKELEGSTTIDNDTTSGSALAPPTCKAPAVISYCPGVQAWYNLWVSPDPTQATAAGVPTRVAFGLEEVWANDPSLVPPTGLDGTLPTRFTVIGRYYAGSTCTLLTATNGLPVCPTGSVPAYTTHPDQHAALWVPDGSGGVTLVVGNDGGVYKQHVASGADLANDAWGQGKPQDANGKPVAGANDGLNTLQPYDAAMANDGTLYMGLQDNGEAKIEPDGSMHTVFGGDGFFSAVDPANSNVAYEEYTGGDIAVTTDGGKTWNDILPTNLTSAQFSTPFEMDPNNANHLMIGGRDIEETTDGPNTTSGTWKKVYDLGTQQHPGDASAISLTGDDPDNQLSAVDVRSDSASAGLPVGPKTADQHYKNKGADTLPGFDSTSGPTMLPTQVPGTYNDYNVTVGANDGDAAMNVDVKWADSADDWDLYIYRDDAGTLTYVNDSASSGTTSEHLRVADPKPGNYVVRVVNWDAAGTYDLDITFDQRTDPGLTSTKSYAYVGYCGFCDTITQGTPFANGIATNVGGDKPGAAGTADGWHIAHAIGLPSRYITSVRMDPRDPRTVYATLAGYGRRWAFPGAVGEDTSKIGTGHVFISTDAGEHFTDITGNLPDTPANWSVLHNGRLVIGTDIGVFVSCNDTGGTYAALGNGLPTAPISTMSFKPNDPDLLVGATYGRGIYTYRFDDAQPLLCHEDASGQEPVTPLEPFGQGAVDVKIAKKVKRKRKQRVRVKLISSVGSPLDGTVRLKASKKHGKLAARPKPVNVHLDAAGKAKLRMKLSRTARRKLAHGKKVKVTAVVKLSDANGRKLNVKKSKKVQRAHIRR
jgi:hypothetical protein